ncbi:LOW QUALITY PROTEIN: hypothetical protein T265_12713 [Opisthorchis viverrini]|uniref:Uncharacterized protein n=1 Tax=Opisthorchis viverrini TaxID=6198 RepID=A0A075A3Z6_OPIVI|nr:LOW QUALITY PROTEIN: hypothetical protein T265_12713 [Opisthorchis viverrini]KER33002.1 LOW QUALITY PROTEIN: hypothetical protein T265_12713 [Opisthorchis viverrini]
MPGFEPRTSALRDERHYSQFSRLNGRTCSHLSDAIGVPDSSNGDPVHSVGTANLEKVQQFRVCAYLASTKRRTYKSELGLGKSLGLDRIKSILSIFTSERANVFTPERLVCRARLIERRPSTCPGCDDRLIRQSGNVSHA